SGSAPFSKLASCHSREVDPTQYDWPMLHWEYGKYPWQPGGDVKPLKPWNTEKAAILAMGWTRQWDRVILSPLYKKLRGQPYWEVRPVAGKPAEFRGDQVWVHFERMPATGPGLTPRPLPAPNPGGFHMVLSCTGPGSERTYADKADDYVGFRFWDTD